MRLCNAILTGICTAILANAAHAQTGACCLNLPDGDAICTVMTADRCSALGGTYQGDDTTCGDTTCPTAPTGACCLTFRGRAHCVELTEDACGLAGGTYQGDDTTCDTIVCSPPTGPCACDVDGDGDADTMDLLAFLDTWFAGTGDFDADGDTDIHDLLGFIHCFVHGCA